MLIYSARKNFIVVKITINIMKISTEVRSFRVGSIDITLKKISCFTVHFNVIIINKNVKPNTNIVMAIFFIH